MEMRAIEGAASEEFGVEAMGRFWQAVLLRLKARVEAVDEQGAVDSDARPEPTLPVTRQFDRN